MSNKDVNEILNDDREHNDYYSELADALNMLDTQCEPLRFEVFHTFLNMVADSGLEGSDSKGLKPNDVMLHAMMEWDLA